MIRAIAIDDEPLALDVLSAHSARLNFLHLEKTFTRASQGIAYLEAHQPQLIFLDIRMPDADGISLARRLPPGTLIIFTTAYPTHAVEGFEVNATDYLLKPVPFARFLQACNRAKERLEGGETEEELYLKENGAWHRIAPSSILYVEAQGNYLKLATPVRNYLVRQTLQDLRTQLPSWFGQVHKSFVINTRRIDRIEPGQVTVGGTELPVSEHYKKELFNSLGLKSA